MLITNPNWNSSNNAFENTDALVSLTGSPVELTFSENVKNFRFQPKAAPAGILPKIEIRVSMYVPVGETLTITSGYGDLVLTASATPSSNEFYTESVAPSSFIPYARKVAESIADAILQNSTYFNNFDIFQTNLILTVIAKQYSSKTVTLGASTTIPLAIVISTFTDSPFFLTNDYIDYQSYVELYMHTGRDLFIPFGDLQNKYRFDLIDQYTLNTAQSTADLNVVATKDYVSPILPMKNLTPSNEIFYMDMGTTNLGNSNISLDEFGNQKRILLPYFIAYADSYRYIESGQRKRWIQGVSAIKWQQLGAADVLLPYDLTQYVWNPNVKFAFNFLTSCPNQKTLTYKSHEFLQFIGKNTTTSGGYYIETLYKFYDGTTLLSTTPVYQSANVWGNISIDVSPSALDINAVELANGALVDTYTVRLRWGTAGANFSQPKTFKFDRYCYRNENPVIFLNEFGAWDSLNFVGEITENLDVESNILTRNLPWNANTINAISDETSIKTEVSASTNYTFRSGLMSNEMLKWSKKLLESTAVYLWNDKYKKYQNILVNSYEYVYDSQVNSTVLVITFTYTNQNNIITR